jgi:hypothetical protein
MTEYVHTDNEGGVQPEVLGLVCIPAFPAMLKYSGQPCGIYSSSFDLGCTHFDAIGCNMSSITGPVASDEPFSTSTITKAFVPGRNLPALTTIFTYDAECRDRWVLPRQRAVSLVVYNTYPGSETAEDYWTSCQPLGYQNIYSPGVCPEGDTLFAVTELQFVFGGSTVK